MSLGKVSSLYDSGGRGGGVNDLGEGVEVNGG